MLITLLGAAMGTVFICGRILLCLQHSCEVAVLEFGLSIFLYLRRWYLKGKQAFKYVNLLIFRV